MLFNFYTVLSLESIMECYHSPVCLPVPYMPVGPEQQAVET